MKNILLIGGAGYVGTVLTSHLLKKGYKVTVLDYFIYQNQFAIHPYLGDPDFNLILGNFCDEGDLKKASARITDVILLGGLVGDPITKKYPLESEFINDKGIKTCLDFYKDKSIDKLIFISTCSNYGLIKGNEVADENFRLSPLSLYAKEKVSNEEYLLSQKETANYTGVVLRFATAFGLSPRMRFDLTISEFTRDLFFSKELLVFDEYTWRPYCHLRDFARLIEILLNADKAKVNFEVFNAGGDINNFTKKMIVDEILKYIPEGNVKYGKQGSDPRNYKVSFKKVKNILGFEPVLKISDGIRELVDAFRVGVYSDSIINQNKYGNYTITYNGDLR
jgi:nucleoside-diphosphate-sugar epimerase